MTARLVVVGCVGLAALLLSAPRSVGVPLGSRSAVVPALLGAWSAGMYVVVAADVPVVLALIGSAAAAAVVRELRHRRAEAAADGRREAVIAGCCELAADLHSGLPPPTALAAVAAEWAEFRGVADAARLGADVPAALRTLADRPGASSLRWVAAAWVVAHRSGAGLAAAMDLAAGSMVEERIRARILATELASARATARLLAVLPVIVLLIGRGAGGDPFGFLLDTVAGTFCLVLGLALAWVGVWWMERIAEGVRRG